MQIHFRRKARSRAPFRRPMRRAAELTPAVVKKTNRTYYTSLAEVLLITRTDDFNTSVSGSGLHLRNGLCAAPIGSETSADQFFSAETKTYTLRYPSSPCSQIARRLILKNYMKFHLTSKKIPTRCAYCTISLQETTPDAVFNCATYNPGDQSVAVTGTTLNPLSASTESLLTALPRAS